MNSIHKNKMFVGAEFGVVQSQIWNGRKQSIESKSDYSK